MLNLVDAVLMRYNQTGGKLTLEDKSIILEHLLSYLKSRIGSIQRDHKQYLERTQQKSDSFHISKNNTNTTEYWK